jgi:threonine efflux protein
MTPFAPLISLVAVGIPMALVPGPTFLLVGQIAMNRSRRLAMLAVFGIVTSGILWASATLVGLAALFATWPWSQVVLRMAGGCYLIYLGIQSWRAHADPAAPTMSVQGNAYLRGLLTDLLNPKCLAFFGSVFSLFIPFAAPLWIKAAAVGTVASIGFFCYGAVAMLFSAPVVQARYLAFGRAIERACGTVMFGFGAALLLGHA